MLITRIIREIRVNLLISGIGIATIWVIGWNFMSFYIIINRDKDGWVRAECPELPGCVSQARDENLALEAIKEAIAIWLGSFTTGLSGFNGKIGSIR